MGVEANDRYTCIATESVAQLVSGGLLAYFEDASCAVRGWAGARWLPLSGAAQSMDWIRERLVLTLLLGRHPRCGALSPIRSLPQHIVQDIAGLIDPVAVSREPLLVTICGVSLHVDDMDQRLRRCRQLHAATPELNLRAELRTCGSQYGVGYLAGECRASRFTLCLDVYANEFLEYEETSSVLLPDGTSIRAPAEIAALVQGDATSRNFSDVCDALLSGDVGEHLAKERCVPGC